MALRRLVERLVSAHGTLSDSGPVSPDQPIQNVNEAFRLAKERLGQPPVRTGAVRNRYRGGKLIQ